MNLQAQQQERTKKYPFLKGDYLRRVICSGQDSSYVYALFEGYDTDDDYMVIDEDGDDDTWFESTGVELTTAEDARAAGFAIIPELSDSYNAVVLYSSEQIKVGCQFIPFDTVRKIAALLD